MSIAKEPTPSGVTKAIQLLQFVYSAMPSQLRLILADAVLTWAEKAKGEALAELAGGPRANGAPESTPFTPHDFTAEGHTQT